MKVPIRDIQIGKRHRKEMGDLAALAESIKTEGLLQPVGITEDQQLVFGERRLRACRDILGWDEIEARVVNVTSIVAGEFAENDIRKDFTVLERVAIAEAVRLNIGNRQGQRTDQLPQKIGEVSKHARETAAEAAKLSGFNNAETLRQATNVVKLGVPALVEKMDRGDVSISAAATIAKSSPAVQEVIVALPTAEQRTAVGKLKEDEERLREHGRKLEKEKGANQYSRHLQKHGRLPTPEEAKTISKLDAKITPASDGKRYSPIPPPTKDEKAAKKRADEIQAHNWRLQQATQQLSWNDIDPVECVAAVNFIDREIIGETIEKAVDWINRFHKEWLRHGK